MDCAIHLKYPAPFSSLWPWKTNKLKTGTDRARLKRGCDYAQFERFYFNTEGKKVLLFFTQSKIVWHNYLLKPMKNSQHQIRQNEFQFNICISLLSLTLGHIMSYQSEWVGGWAGVTSVWVWLNDICVRLWEWMTQWVTETVREWRCYSVSKQVNIWPAEQWI